MSSVWRDLEDLLKSVMCAHPLFSVHHFTFLVSDISTIYIPLPNFDKPDMSLLKRVDDALYVAIITSH